MANLAILDTKKLIEIKNQALDEQNGGMLLECYQELFRREPYNSIYLDGIVYAAILAEKWEICIEYALKSLEYPENYLNALDGLSHSYHFLGDRQKCREYGSKALYYRHNQILKDTELPILPQVLPREGKKVISFSLFGGNNPKYIESAVLNAELVGQIYPGWVCRFYVDDSIPVSVIKRLSNHGAEIFTCLEDLHHIPKTMWRFLALADPNVSHVIFRDADSVISPRESAAVQEWLNSGKYFHTLRDHGSQTDLILAGMWGAICGVLPNIIELMNDFVQKGNLDKRFADQHFLAQYLWKYIIQSVYATDSVFDFLDSHPFPISETAENFVGRIETFSTAKIEGKWNIGDKIKWTLYSRISPFIAESYDDFTLLDEERFICEYEVVTTSKTLVLNLPRRYLKHFKYSRLDIKVVD